MERDLGALHLGCSPKFLRDVLLVFLDGPRAEEELVARSGDEVHDSKAVRIDDADDVAGFIRRVRRVARPACVQITGALFSRSVAVSPTSIATATVQDDASRHRGNRPLRSSPGGGGAAMARGSSLRELFA